MVKIVVEFCSTTFVSEEVRHKRRELVNEIDKAIESLGFPLDSYSVYLTDL